jgi:glycosyltransferase involved in cell wall biosynthesis
MAPSEPVAIVHDYLTQRGGAERVVLAMARAFPGAPVWTSLYAPERTFPEFRDVDVRTTWLDRLAPLRRHHRLALPLLAPAFSSLHVDGAVVLCSSSGWAHGARANGGKVVYCHSPARWLYQADRYVDGGLHASRGAAGRGRAGAARAALAALGGPLRRWDAEAARSADRYLVNSSAVAASVRAIYGIEAEILPPPPALDPEGSQREVAGLAPGFWLCVSRLLPYKNVDLALRATAARGEPLVVVGEGPERATLERLAPATATFTGALEDDQLRWCYANCRGVIAASFEDFGLTPLEGAAFGKPCAALRFGGYLDTVIDGRTGCFFDRPDASDLSAALERLEATEWDLGLLLGHAAAFGADRFAARLREVVAEVAGLDHPVRPARLEAAA